MSERATPTDPLIGSLVGGRFRVQERIAHGGMGIVYRAVQEPLGRLVALKVIRPEALDALARSRFEREARIASAISDPRIVTVHDFGGGDELLYLAMELLHGETLRARLLRGPLPWHEGAAIFRDVAGALAAAHERGLVHRDLKPENVMLVGGAPARVKVLDFGLAKDISDLLGTSSPTLTQSGGFVGTPGYLAPEAMNGVRDDPRQDVYALGVLIWECTVGRHPFAAETPLKTIVRGMQEEVPPLEEGTRRIQGAPLGLPALIAALSARDPAARPADGRAARRALEQLDALEPATGTTATSASGTRAPDVDHELLARAHVRHSMISDAPVSTAIAPSPVAAVPVVAVPVSAARAARSLPIAIAIAAAALVAVAVAVMTNALTERARDPSPVIVAAAAALARGNAVEALAGLRSITGDESEPSLRVRALMAAATQSAILLNMRMDGRVTGVSFVDDGHVAVSNRNHAVEQLDLVTGERHRIRAHVSEVTAVGGGEGALVSCDLRGNVRREVAGVASMRQPIAQLCTSVDSAGGVVWSAHGAGVFRWRDHEMARVPIDIFAPTFVHALGADRALVSMGPRIVEIDRAAGAVAAEPSALAAETADITVVTSSVTLPEDVHAFTASRGGDVIIAGGARGGVYRVQRSADGKFAAAELLRRHGGPVGALAISPDGTLLASAGAGEAVRIGPPDGPPLRVLVDGPSEPIGLAFSPDGRRLAVIARDALVVVDVERLLSEQQPTRGHRRPVEAVDVVGGTAWSGGGDGMVFRWDLRTGRGTPMFAFDATVEDLDVASDGRTLALALSDGRALVVDADSGSTLGGWVHPGGCSAMRFSRDEQWLAAAGRDGRVFVAERARLVPRLVGDISQSAEPHIASVGFSPDGARLVAGGKQGRLLIMDLVHGGQRDATQNGCGTIFTVAFDDSGMMHTPCNGASIVRRRLDGDLDPVVVPVTGAFYSVAVTPDGTRVSAGGSGTVLLERGVLRSLGGSKLPVNRTVFTADGLHVVTGADDSTLRLLSLTGNPPAAFSLDVRRAIGAAAPAALPAGARFADARGDVLCIATERDVSEWSLATGARRGTAPIDRPLVGVVATAVGCAVATTEDVRFLSAGADAARVQLAATGVGRDDDGIVVGVGRDLVFLGRDGTRRGTQTLEGEVAATAVWSASDVVVVGRADGTVERRARATATGIVLTDASTSAVRSVASGPDGALAAGFENGELLVWDADGDLVDRTRLHGPVVHVTFSAAGLRASSSLGDVETRLQPLSAGRAR